jgi:transcription elongation factor Elf1
MSDYKMQYLPDECDARQQMDDEERQQYEQEYGQWLDELEKKSKLQREEQDDTNSKGT